MNFRALAPLPLALLVCGCSVVMPVAGYLADQSEAKKSLKQINEQTRYDVTLRSGRMFKSVNLTTFDHSDTLSIKGSKQLDTVVRARDVAMIQAPITPLWTVVGATLGIVIDLAILNSIPNMTLVGQRENRSTP